MMRWLTTFDFWVMLGAASVLILGAVVIWQLFAAAWRDHRLSALDPPTRDELEEARSLRRPGSFHLVGRTSAPARHFEASRLHMGGTNREGSRGCLEPYLEHAWRDRRSDD